MAILSTTQYTCLLFCILSAFMLAASRFFIKWNNRRYETSRWILVTAMLLLAVHYFLQLFFGLRKQGDDVGTVINLLFYTPAASLITYSLFHLEGGLKQRRRFMWYSIACYALIMATFAIGYLQHHSLHIGNALNVMLALNLLYLSSYIFAFFRIIKHKRSIIENEYGGDTQSYDTYIHTGFFILSAFAVISISLSFSRTLLIIASPLFLFSLFFFMMSFISLGYNTTQLRNIFQEENDTESTAEPETNTSEETHEEKLLSDQQMQEIEDALTNWIDAKGYQNSDITMTELSKLTNVSRKDLRSFIEQKHRCTFRIWLSGIRFNEAKRIMKEHPEYSNEVISYECGLASRAQLYNVFRTYTGMTPKEWKEKECI